MTNRFYHGQVSAVGASGRKILIPTASWESGCGSGKISGKRLKLKQTVRNGEEFNKGHMWGTGVGSGVHC